MMRLLLIAWLAAFGALAGNAGSDPMPLFFIANHGQAPPTVCFMARGSELTAYFSPDEALFRVADTSLHLRFIGASPSPRVEGVEALAARANFLIGTRNQWHTGVPLYRAIAYRNLYPGIDMIYGGDGRNLKSEFVVAPGADPGKIRLRYDGSTAPRIDQSGALIISVAGRDLREEAPLIYQDKNGDRATVNGSFSLADDGTVSFTVNQYDRSLPLVIDPTISYSTLFGGSSSDAAMAVALDSSGAAYIAGFTASYDLPTAGPEQGSNAGGNDIFVAKLSPGGNSLLYATYIGGAADDRAFGIAVDGTGAAYVTGSTTSSNFPVRYALQSKFGGVKDAFILKLSAAGNSLVFSTYLGGSGSDAGYAIAIDSNKNVYITGDTSSINFPATGMQKNNRGGQDAFVAKLSADGTHLVYSTYVGGSNTDHGAAIAVDSSGDAYITGSTWSTDFPVASASQSQLAGGQDAFIAKLAADGNSLLFSTFFGGSGGSLGYPEAGQGIAVDSQGNAYVAGVTSSFNFPLSHAIQISLGGWSDAFAAKFTSAGVLVYSTYLGGTGVDSGNAIAIDTAGNAYIAGQTMSSDLPVVNATQSTRGGDYDAFWAKLSPAGDTLLALSYLGGNGSDTATAIALDAAGSLYVSGWTLSTNFPVLNGYQSTNGGNYGAFVTKISMGAFPSVVGVTPNSGTGASQTFSFQFADSAGASGLASVSIVINSSLSILNACSVTYNVGANALVLLTDDGSAFSGSIVPGSGSQQNSQCTLSGTGSSVSLAGNILTLNLAISFQPAFSGSKAVYLQAAAGPISTGWQQAGTWTVPAAGPPAVLSVTPNAGVGTTQTFTFIYSDARGYAAILSSQILFNGSMSMSNGCYLFFNRAANTVYLTNDAGTAWQSPVTLGQAGTLQNSQCSVDPLNSAASGGGTLVTLNLTLTFQQSFGGAKNIYAEVYDGSADSGWQQLGTFTIPTSGPPSTLSVTPSSGSGSSQTFTFVFSDPQGYAAIRSAQILINSSMSPSGACYLFFNRAANAVYLTNDPGTAWQSPVTLGQAGTLQNSQCSVNPVNSSASGSGTTVTLNLALTFTASFLGAKNVYTEVYDGANDSGWTQPGTWTVPGSGPPSAVSVNPNSGSGLSQVFTFTLSDPAGYTALMSSQILINSAMTFSGGCYMLYYRPANAIYLTNDAGTAWQTPVTLGQSGTLQNSQCSINPANSSASGSGNTLTLNVALTFKSAFSGAKSIYAEAYDGSADSGWHQLGSWTVPSSPYGSVRSNSRPFTLLAQSAFAIPSRKLVM